MTDEEAKEAFKAQSPIICNVGTTEIEYLCISALIHRIKNGKYAISLELLDKSEHSVTISTPSRCKLKEE